MQRMVYTSRKIRLESDGRLKKENKNIDNLPDRTCRHMVLGPHEELTQPANGRYRVHRP